MWASAAAKSLFHVKNDMAILAIFTPEKAPTIRSPSGPDTPRKGGSRVPGRARASAAGRGGVTRTLGRVSVCGARSGVAYFARETATRAAVGAESASPAEKALFLTRFPKVPTNRSLFGYTTLTF